MMERYRSCPLRNGACVYCAEYRGLAFRLAPEWLGHRIVGSSSLYFGLGSARNPPLLNRHFGHIGADAGHFRL